MLDTSYIPKKAGFFKTLAASMVLLSCGGDSLTAPQTQEPENTPAELSIDVDESYQIPATTNMRIVAEDADGLRNLQVTADLPGDAGYSFTKNFTNQTRFDTTITREVNQPGNGSIEAIVQANTPAGTEQTSASKAVDFQNTSVILNVGYADARVRIYDLEQNVLSQGKTDENKQYIFEDEILQSNISQLLSVVNDSSLVRRADTLDLSDPMRVYDVVPEEVSMYDEGSSFPDLVRGRDNDVELTDILNSRDPDGYLADLDPERGGMRVRFSFGLPEGVEYRFENFDSLFSVADSVELGAYEVRIDTESKHSQQSRTYEFNIIE